MRLFPFFPLFTTRVHILAVVIWLSVRLLFTTDKRARVCVCVCVDGREEEKACVCQVRQKKKKKKLSVYWYACEMEETVSPCENEWRRGVARRGRALLVQLHVWSAVVRKFVFFFFFFFYCCTDRHRTRTGTILSTLISRAWSLIKSRVYCTAGTVPYTCFWFSLSSLCVLSLIISH